MSTYKTVLLSSAFLAVFSLASTSVPVQSDTGPVKLYGPKVIVTSTKSARASLGKDGSSYTYEVELNHTSAFNTTVSVTDVTDSAQPIDYAVVVPAGQLSTTFEVVAAIPGEDLLIASNPNRTASLAVTVL
jgi:hypothetical protein